ncbi:MAG: fused MFS/spermidine synthase [Bacteroidales bacterium]
MFRKTEDNLKYSLIILGFTAIVTQIIIIREFLSVFSGNELVVGVLLANWMLLTALGAYLGKFFKSFEIKFDYLIISQLLMGILPIMSVYLLYFLKFDMYPPGKMIALMDITIGSIFLLLPFCLISGSLFTIVSSLLSAVTKSNVINQVYSLEAFGSIIGGLLFNFIFIFILKTFYSLTILLMLNFFIAALNIYILDKKHLSFILTTGTIAITILLIFSNLDLRVQQFIYPGHEIVYHNETPFGKVIITKQNNQYNFYENGIPTFNSDDIITKEETVHYAMVQHEKPENVLLISGGYTGTLAEILKYHIHELDYIELNPVVLKVGEKYTENLFKDDRIKIINSDARKFLRENEKKYDVALLHVSDPENIQLNRYYTLEFFELLKTRLSEDAVISTSLKSTSNYVSDEAAKINASLMATLKLVFKNVIIVQGERNYFIASDQNLSFAITNLISLRTINSSYVNKNYLNDYRITERGKQIAETISNEGDINYDFKPIAYFLHLKYWLSYFNKWIYLLGLLILIPILVIVSRMHTINFGLFVTGISSTAIEVILIIGFQVIYGYIYHMMGILITVFMAGLAIGSYYLIKKIAINSKTYSLIQYLIGILSIPVPLILYALQYYVLNGVIIHFVFIFLIMSIGIFTGIQFSLASKIRATFISEIAANSYSAELLGAAVGAITVTAILIPLIGLIKVSLIIGILNIIAGLLILIRLTNRK